MAAKSPAGPAPIIMTSAVFKVKIRNSYRFAGKSKQKQGYNYQANRLLFVDDTCSNLSLELSLIYSVS